MSLNFSHKTLSPLEEGVQLTKILLIQNTFKKYLLRKRKKFMMKLLNSSKIFRVTTSNFISLINEKIKELISGIVNLKKFKNYKFENFRDFFALKINLSKFEEYFKYFRFTLDPVMVINSPFSFWREYYWGEWNSLGQIEGFGMKIYSNGNFFIGTFKNNKMDGIGAYVFANKIEKIEKNFYSCNEDYIKNIVKYNKDYADLKLYETVDRSANYKYSLFREKKTFYKLNFEVNNREYFYYQGEFKNDKFHGFGDIYFRNINLFSGKFDNNKITGKGKFYKKK